jgi:subtilisin family serine protease
MRHAALLLAGTLLTLSGGMPVARAQTAAAPAAMATPSTSSPQTAASTKTPPTSSTEARHPLIVVTFANNPGHPAGRAGTTARRYSGTGYLLGQAAHREARRVAETYALREVANWPIRALAVHCVVYEVPDDRPVATVIDALAKDPQISLAQPLQEFHTLTDSSSDAPYNDPLYDLQTNLSTLGIPEAHARSQGSGVRVALIDTGVDTSHPDLRDRIASSHSFVDGAPAAAAGGNRHGTAMAGLIAATANNRIGIVGVAPQARVEVYEACWQLQPNADEAACNTFTLAKALAGAIDAGIPLVNLSIAGPADPLLSALIEAGLKRGSIFVGAAAGDGNSFPANVPGVIGVGSSEHPAGHPTVTAPSVHVMTLRPRAQYDFVSGTSVAAAEVTGVVALLLSADPHLTGSSVEGLLKRTRGNGAEANSAEALNLVSSVDANAALAGLDAARARRVASSTAR